ncbi:hypothetical protein [Komagataeibacter intermedius]|uniref:hypothetical protein n=1 Tax=Komagataeibacter intermedius TaxID=66229 RepID=UPI003B4309D8
MTNPKYATARAVPTVMADPTTLDPKAVRCLWTRPVPAGMGDATYLPSVVFVDGTECPLACAMDGLAARQFCQKIAAVHDWPVKDGRALDESREVAQARIMASLDDNDRKTVDGVGMVNMPGTGRIAAMFAHDAGLPYGFAMEAVTRRLTALFRQMVIPGQDTDEHRQAAMDAATDKMAELYRGEKPQPGLSELGTHGAGVVIADYCHDRNRTDDDYQRALTATLEALGDLWTERGIGEVERNRMTDEVMDTSLRRWFALTGRVVAG